MENENSIELPPVLDQAISRACESGYANPSQTAQNLINCSAVVQQVAQNGELRLKPVVAKLFGYIPDDIYVARHRRSAITLGQQFDTLADKTLHGACAQTLIISSVLFVQDYVAVKDSVFAGAYPVATAEDQACLLSALIAAYGVISNEQHDTQLQVPPFSRGLVPTVTAAEAGRDLHGADYQQLFAGVKSKQKPMNVIMRAVTQDAIILPRYWANEPMDNLPPLVTEGANKMVASEHRQLPAPMRAVPQLRNHAGLAAE